MTDRYKNEVIDPNDRASKFFHRVCLSSFKNSKAVEIVARQPDNFRGGVDFVWKKHILRGMLEGEIRETIQNDGAGGKPQFFALVGTRKIFRRLGWEIITMDADDIARVGGLAAIMANDMNVKRITKENFHLIKEVGSGFAAALAQSGISNITGEIAVMKHSITAFCDVDNDKQLILTWGAACLGLVRTDRFIDGSAIEPDMPIVGLHEDGYRCNGGTFFTNLIMARFAHGLPENLVKNQEAIRFAESLTVPSKSYARFISRMNGWLPDGSARKPLIKMAGIAHITGGGIWRKFGELLPRGVGAHLYYMPKPPEILLEAQKLSGFVPELMLTDRQAYGTFHGGCGMLVVCKSNSDAVKMIEEAKKDGIKASIVGVTSSSKDREVIIKSRFREKRELSSKEE